MNVIVPIGIGLVVVLAFLARTVIRAEYGWWGPRVAEKTITLASAIAGRPGQRDEWLGELTECQTLGIPGVLFALQLVPAGVRMRARHIYMKHRRAGLFHSEWFLVLGAMQLVNSLMLTIGTSVDLSKGDFSGAAWAFAVVVGISLIGYWTIRCELRCIDVKWVAACTGAGPTREQLMACLWTRGERAALAAWDDAWRSQGEGAPWALAQRPLSVYRMGRMFNSRLFAWRARHLLTTPSVDAECAPRR